MLNFFFPFIILMFDIQFNKPVSDKSTSTHPNNVWLVYIINSNWKSDQWKNSFGSTHSHLQINNIKTSEIWSHVFIYCINRVQTREYEVYHAVQESKFQVLFFHWSSRINSLMETLQDWYICIHHLECVSCFSLLDKKKTFDSYYTSTLFFYLWKALVKWFKYMWNYQISKYSPILIVIRGNVILINLQLENFERRI